MHSHVAMRCASAIAQPFVLAISTLLWSVQGYAQSAQGPEKPNVEEKEKEKRSTTQLDEVIVTGSLIRGTAKDTALPVTVVTREEMEAMGVPTALEMVRNMPEVGNVQGESQLFSGLPPGAVSVNLRNLRSSRTVVLLNGRRLPPQAGSSIGGFQNVNLIPSHVLERIETLKDGGAATYGADAVGGVQNYITRKNFDGIETGGAYTFIRNSQGDYNAYVNWGLPIGDKGNLLISLSYDHRSELRMSERNYSNGSYLENPNDFAWPITGSPGGYGVQTRTTATTYTPITPVGTGINQYLGTRHVASNGIVRDKYCLDLGGFAGWGNTPTPLCRFHASDYINLADVQDQYHLFSQYTHTFSDSIQFQSEALYWRHVLPRINDHPSTPPALWPAAVPNGPQNGLTVTPFGFRAYQTPGTNPAVLQWLNDYDNAYTPAQIANITNPAAPGRIMLPEFVWRPFAVGGNPAFGNGTNYSHRFYETARISAGVVMDLGEGLWSDDLNLNTNLSYSHNVFHYQAQQMLASRLELALRGYGSLAGTPGCSVASIAAANTDAGANAGNTAMGCYFLNPFSSAIRANMNTGQINPGFVGTGTYAGYLPGQGLQNSPELADWLYEPIDTLFTQQYYVFDTVLTGAAKLNLPGGPIGWAAGVQFRWLAENRKVTDLQFYNPNRIEGLVAPNPCYTPGDTSCLVTASGAPGAATSVFVALPFGDYPYHRRYPVGSAYMELKLPIHETFHAQVASRYEKFYNTRGGPDIDAFIPTLALKWAPLEWLAVRGSIGEHFGYVEPLPAAVFVGQARVGRIPNTALTGSETGYRDTYFTQNSDLKSETGTSFNFGLIFKLGTSFMATVDFFGTKIKGIPFTPSVDELVNRVFTRNTGTVAAPVWVVDDCSHPYLQLQSGDVRPLVELNGACVPGTTTALAVQSVSNTNVNSDGVVNTQAIDLGLTYRLPTLWGVNTTINSNTTWNLKYDVGGNTFKGVEYSVGYNGLGLTNDGPGMTLGQGQRVQRWRGTLSLNFNYQERHNVNWLMSYGSSYKDARAFFGTPEYPGSAPTSSPWFVQNVFNANTGSACNLAPGEIPAGAGTATTGAITNTTPTLAFGQFFPSCNVTPVKGKEIPRMFHHAVTYGLTLSDELRFSLTIDNVFDKDPPFARQIASYEPYLGRPYGRTFKLEGSKRF